MKLDKFEHAWAVIRIDKPAVVTVKKVVWDADFAKSEVERLNKLNSDKQCFYSCQITRIEKR